MDTSMIKKIANPYNLEAAYMLKIHFIILLICIIIYFILSHKYEIGFYKMLLCFIPIYFPLIFVEYIFTFKTPLYLFIEKNKKNNSIIRELKIQKIYETVSTSGYAFSCILDKIPPYYQKYIIICVDKECKIIKLKSAITGEKSMLLDELIKVDCFIDIEYTKLSKVILSYNINTNIKNNDVKYLLKKVNNLL